MTIYDIAKAAGVSASTVSRVINNKPGINEKTRSRIKKYFKKMIIHQMKQHVDLLIYKDNRNFN